MVETEYYRCGSTIRSVALNADGHSTTIEHHDSIGKAKRVSRMMQLGNGGLGAGYVKVLQPKAKPKKGKIPGKYSNKYKKFKS